MVAMVHIISYHHNQIFDSRAGAGASSTSVGPFPGNWLAARIADLTPDLQMLLSCGSTVVSFHSWLMLIIYTFNSKCQKSSKSHARFLILKVSIMILVF